MCIYVRQLWTARVNFSQLFLQIIFAYKLNTVDEFDTKLVKVPLQPDAVSDIIVLYYYKLQPFIIDSFSLETAGNVCISPSDLLHYFLK